MGNTYSGLGLHFLTPGSSYSEIFCQWRKFTSYVINVTEQLMAKPDFRVVGLRCLQADLPTSNGDT